MFKFENTGSSITTSTDAVLVSLLFTLCLYYPQGTELKNSHKAKNLFVSVMTDNPETILSQPAIKCSKLTIETFLLLTLNR